MALTVTQLTDKIRQQAGEIEILKLGLIEKDDDIATLRAQLEAQKPPEVIPPEE